jgi:hypothetical protein
VGFEPTCRLPDKTLSRRPRYDHFGTSPVDQVGPSYYRVLNLSRKLLVLDQHVTRDRSDALLAAETEERLEKGTTLLRSDARDNLEPVVVPG